MEPVTDQVTVAGLEVRKDILETAKMLILDQQRDAGEESLLTRIEQLEDKIDLILQAVKKSD